jgi:hypothetical protein
MGQLGVDFDEWLDFRFSYVDQPDSQIDSLWWDIGAGSWAVYPSDVLPRFEHPGLRLWWDQGIDWVRELIAETHRRGLEAFWNHRVSEVDLSPTDALEPGCALMMDRLNPVKAAHPDWVVKTWWWQGLWNYAVPAVREHQLAILEELASRYDLDGLQLDFARHVPCLPVGRQWELREQVTEFVRMVRGMLLQVAEQRGRPFLLAARIPQTLDGCRQDGFDIAAWAREGLVDILTLGSRSMEVDVAGFAEIVAGRNIKLQPCFDDHHATDGYRYQPIEFLRGVFGNWWQQGADSVATFNWANASPELCEQTIGERWGRGMFNEPGPASHGQAYREAGSPQTLAGKGKVFAVERRGGYPWAEGFFNRNDEAPLPAPLRNDGEPLCLRVRLGDPIRADADRVKALILRAVLFGAREGDRIEARLNGVALPLIAEDHGWQDAQILSPAPQPPSGGSGRHAVNPDQKLLCLDFAVPPGLCRLGPNQAELAVRDRVPYVTADIVLEKLELHLSYR